MVGYVPCSQGDRKTEIFQDGQGNAAADEDCDFEGEGGGRIIGCVIEEEARY